MFIATVVKVIPPYTPLLYTSLLYIPSCTPPSHTPPSHIPPLHTYTRTYITHSAFFGREEMKEYVDVTLNDLVRVETLGMGGFGRVELVRMLDG